MNPKMIESFIEPTVRTPVDNDGGIKAFFFTLGTNKQMLDNNKFLNTFDIISIAPLAPSSRCPADSRRTLLRQ